MTFLCDTNIISELVRPQPNPGVIAWSKQISSISMSVITLEEIAYGLAAKPNARVQAMLENFLQTNCQILPITETMQVSAPNLPFVSTRTSNPNVFNPSFF
jgi:predicted nucleic acid-binding protein